MTKLLLFLQLVVDKNFSKKNNNKIFFLKIQDFKFYIIYYNFSEIMSNFVKITNEELNLQEIIDLVCAADCGAISTFIGLFNLFCNKLYA